MIDKLPKRYRCYGEKLTSKLGYNGTTEPFQEPSGGPEARATRDDQHATNDDIDNGRGESSGFADSILRIDNFFFLRRASGPISMLES